MMEDFSRLTASEMFARRDAAEAMISSAIGKFVFKYSSFVTSLHLCVAWQNDGKEFDSYSGVAEDLGVAELLKRIEKHARTRLGVASVGFKRYKAWVIRAHKLREFRNLLMHSRWQIEPYGRHAIAIQTPILVEQVKQFDITGDQIEELCQSCAKLADELYKLRKEIPV